jgi:hypothetical protein
MRTEDGSKLSVLLVLQTLSFPLSYSAHFAWKQTMIAKPLRALAALALSFVSSGDVVFFLLLAWAVGVLASFVWLALALSTEEGAPSWAIKVRMCLVWLCACGSAVKTKLRLKT